MCRSRWLECKYGNKSCATENGIYLFQITPAGQDFSFPVTMQDDDLDSLIGNIKEYYDNFDVDEEAYLWLDETGHGKNGAPYRMKDVVKDMEEAEKMIDRLLDVIMELEQSL